MCLTNNNSPTCYSSTPRKRKTTMATTTKEKEVNFLKKLKTRFNTDIEFIGGMLDMLEDGMISQESFMCMIKELVGKGIKKASPVISGTCR